jgi:hypothetical protein
MSFEMLRGIVKVTLSAALVLVIFAGQSHAQRRGSLQNSVGQGRCSGHQSGTSNSLQSQPYSSGFSQSQLYPYLQQQDLYALQQQQLLMQAQVNNLQANALQGNALQANAVQANARQINKLRQYVLEQQMLGVAPEDALQSALYALQRNRR